MPYYPVTLDVERARRWLGLYHPYRECRDLAELIHDYSLTVVPPYFPPKPVDPRREEIANLLVGYLTREQSCSRADAIIAALDK